MNVGFAVLKKPSEPSPFTKAHAHFQKQRNIKCRCQDPRKILNVSEDSTLEEIKDAYRNLMKRSHPDVSGSDGKQAVLLINAYRELREGTNTLYMVTRN